MKKLTYPLHLAQVDIYYDQLVHSRSPHYNVGGYIKIKGNLNKDRLIEIASYVPKVFDVFKMRFTENKDGEILFMGDYCRISISEIDFSDQINPASSALKWIQDRFNIAFQFSESCPPFEQCLLKIDTAEYWLYNRCHHLVTDGFGFTVWAKYLALAYRNSNEITLHPHYLNEIDSSIRYLDSNEYNRDKKYWNAKLTSLPERLLERKYSPQTAGKHASHSFSSVLNSKLRAQLDEFCLSTSFNLQQVTIAAVAAYFGKTTRRTEFVFGIPVHRRNNRRVQKIMGSFSGIIPFVCQYSSHSKSSDFLRYIKRSQASDYRYHNYLMSHLNRDLGNTSKDGSLFDVVISYERLDFDVDFGDDVYSEVVRVTSEHEIIPLTVTWRDFGNNQPLQLHLNYHAEFFSDEEIKLIADRLIYIIGQLIDGASLTMDQIEIIPAAELVKIRKFSYGREEIAYSDTLDRLIEHSVSMFPDSIAISYQDELLSYGELNQRANQFARYLISRDVGAGDLVAIFADKSLELVIGMLGIIKVGAAYVPIDTRYPIDRVRLIASNCNSKVTVISSDTGLLLEGAGEIIDLKEDWQTVAKFPKHNLHRDNNIEQLFYVIYTSGSTGIPKGVRVSQRGVVNLLSWYIREFSLSEKDANLVVGSLGFDLTQKNIFASLIVGGVLVFPKTNDFDEETITDLILQRNITVVNCAPSMFYPLVQKDEHIDKLNSLRLLILGGESIQIRQFKKWTSKAKYSCEIVNTYGPTECTDIATCYRIKEIDGIILPTIPIGHPIFGTKVFILNGNEELQPLGVLGEIYIGGAGVGLGYFNDEVLNSEKFKFISICGESHRLYKTGDFGRMNMAGEIEYLGRLDRQVKLRGYRIELGEIEQVLRQHSSINLAAVLVNDEGKHEKLIAFVSFSGTFEKGSLMAFLRKKLPPYMIPQEFIPLDEFPLTPNGKIDYGRLSGFERENYEEDLAPSNMIEKQLCDIWASVLGVQNIGVNSDFFDFGGNSLTAARIVSLVNKKFQIKIPVEYIFDHSSIRRFAAGLNDFSFSPSRVSFENIESTANLPLSYEQERLWIIDQLEGTTHYIIPVVLRVEGQISLSALEFALNAVLRRHESLRMLIYEENSIAFQKISENDHSCLEYVDIGQEFQSIASSQIVESFLAKPFDLKKDLKLRALLVEHSKNVYDLAIAIHHIACDGQSLVIIIKELFAIYNSYLDRCEPELSTSNVKFSDFVLWQKEYLGENEIERKLFYWKNKLAGIRPLKLPTHFSVPASVSNNSDTFTFSLNEEMLLSLSDISKSNSCTLFMSLLTLFKIFLHKYTGQQDISILTPVSVRANEDLKDVVGFFVNTIVLRSEVRGNLSFLTLLKQIRETFLSSYEYQDVPYNRIVKCISDMDFLDHSIFNVMFAFEEDEKLNIEDGFKGCVTRLQSNSHNTAKFDLTFTLKKFSSRLDIVAEYRTDLFSRETLKKMCEHFRQLSVNVMRSPELPISHLDMLLEDDFEIISSSNELCQSKYQETATILDLFERQVSQLPDRVAVNFGDIELTFSVLNERANRLANYLRALGVTRGCLVCLCMDRSEEIIVAILAILKTGAAYVPIDPEYPDDRIIAILKDTDAGFILIDKSVHWKYDCKIVNLGDEIDALKIQSQSSENLKVDIRSNDLAYVIYTSGSTGRPRGVMVEHRNVVRLLMVENSPFDFKPDDTWIVVHSFCFDFAVWEIFGALFFGARMVIASNREIMDASMLKTMVYDHCVTVLNLTPSLFYTISEEIIKGTDEACLRFLIFGGESLKKSKLKAWSERFKKCKIINMYGITETTVHVTHFEINSENLLDDRDLIGRPIPTTSLFVMDSFGKPTPVGVFGELCVGGAGLARGYLNSPELTAEKFILGGFGGKLDTVLYRSGDVGRLLDSRTFEFAGRLDDQISIRGYRVEPGEIEATLLMCEYVEHAIVTPQESHSGLHLIAYIVPRGIYREELIVEFLEGKLPSHMIPNYFVEIQDLPLTNNGKIDKRSLPVVNTTSVRRATYRFPDSLVKGTLARIWEEVLDVGKIGLDDNFFHLGGDSIMAIQVANRLKHHGFDIHANDIFVHQTIARLSEVIEQSISSTHSNEQGKLIGECGLIPIQHWYLRNMRSGRSHFNHTFLLCIDKDFSEDEVRFVLEELISNHDSLTLRYQKDGRGWIQYYDMLPSDFFKVEDFGKIRTDNFGDSIDKIINSYQQEINISDNVLIRVVFIETPETEVYNRIIFLVHHILVDGVSWRIILEDFEMLLRQFKVGGNLDLGPKSTSYRQWYDALSEYGRNLIETDQVFYWERVLQSYAEFPIDFCSRADVLQRDTKNIVISLNDADTLALTKAFVGDTEIKDVLITALVKTLCEWSKMDTIVVGLEAHGRHDSLFSGLNTSRTTGWFTSIFPVAITQPPETEGIRDWISAVVKQLSHVPDYGIGYGILKYFYNAFGERLDPDWNVLFNFLGRVDNSISSEILQIAPERVKNSIGEFHVVSDKLSFTSLIENGQLSIYCCYSTVHYKHETISKICNSCRTNLQLMIE